MCIQKLRVFDPATAVNLVDMDTPTKKRHQIAYIAENQQSWITRLERGNPLPAFAVVRTATAATVPIPVDYDRDGLTWRSDFRICISYDNNAVQWKRLVLHFPNDGFFYVDEKLLPVLASNRRNEKHMGTCSNGLYLEQSGRF